MKRCVVERSACPGELLDGACRRPFHGQVRTERVPRDVHTLYDARHALGAPDGFDDAIARGPEIDQSARA